MRVTQCAGQVGHPQPLLPQEKWKSAFQRCLGALVPALPSCLALLRSKPEPLSPQDAPRPKRGTCQSTAQPLAASWCQSLLQNHPV